MPTTGTYEKVDGRPVVRFERTFPHPVDAVWAAVTEPAQLEEWFPTTVDLSALEVGAPIVFRFAEDAYPPMTGEVLEVEADRRFAFSWGDDRLTFELEPRDAGESCRLIFTVVLDSEDKAARDGAGWEQCLDALALVAAGGVVHRPLPPQAWRSYYEEYQQRGFPATAPIPEPPEG
jgi:uncharacterized protein YndB with AHSA1/START domain